MSVPRTCGPGILIEVEFSNVSFLRERKTGRPVKKKNLVQGRTPVGDPGERALATWEGVEASNHLP